MIWFCAFANPNFVTGIERYAPCAPTPQFQDTSREAKNIRIYSVKLAFGHAKRHALESQFVLILECGGLIACLQRRLGTHPWTQESSSHARREAN